jgi:hypothetical protein
MGRLIEAIFGKQIGAVEVRKGRGVVNAGLPTLALRLLDLARFLKARSAGRPDTSLVAPSRCYAVSVRPCTTGIAMPAGMHGSPMCGHGRLRWPGHAPRGMGV